MDSEKNHHFWALDLMRGISAIAVVIYHCTATGFPLAYAAVDLFFLLSGVVIAQHYGEALKDRAYWKTFLRKRVARLYPVYLFATLIGLLSVLPLVGRLEGFSVKAYLATMVTAPFLLPTPKETLLGIFPANGPAWSLFFEAAINVAFIFTAARFRTSAAVFFISAILFVAVMVHFPYSPGSMWEDIWGGVPRVAASFYCGVLLLIAWRSGLRVRIKAEAVLVLAALVLLLYSGWIVTEKKYYLFLVFIIHPLVIWPMLGAAKAAWIEPVATLLGKLSYPLYLIHIPVLITTATLGIGDCQGLRNYLGLGNSDWGVGCAQAPAYPAIAVVLPVSLLLAYVICVTVQEPGKRLLSARRARPTA